MIHLNPADLVGRDDDNGRNDENGRDDCLGLFLLRWLVWHENFARRILRSNQFPR